MVAGDKPHFTEVLRHFCTVHGKTLSKELLRAYWEDLQGMSLADFDHATDKLRRTSEWMPKPAQIWAASRTGWT